jgi:hypothetical protein
MKRDLDVIKADARSTNKDFNRRLISEGVLPKYFGSYAKDHHYEKFGFDFVSTEDDIEHFLNELDRAPEAFLGRIGKCIKAREIRRKLEKDNTYGWDNLSRFRLFASSARRICCACHETGSYKSRYSNRLDQKT